jgi:hypothetical protein
LRKRVKYKYTMQSMDPAGAGREDQTPLKFFVLGLLFFCPPRLPVPSCERGSSFPHRKPALPVPVTCLL